MNGNKFFIALAGLFLAVFFLLVPAWQPILAQSGTYTVSISQIDKSKFPEIRVYVSVVDQKGNPVSNLKESDFILKEDGTKVNFTLPAAEISQNGFTTVLVIDRSGSMQDEGKMDAAKQAAITYIDLLSPQDNMAILTFSSDAKVVQDLTVDKDILKAKVGTIVTESNTALLDGISRGTDLLLPVNGRKAIILLSDGGENASRINRNDLMTKVRDAGFSVFCIGLGQGQIDADFLQKLASDSGGKMFLSPSPADLTSFYTLIHTQVSGEYKLVYNSPKPTEDGTRRQVELTVASQGDTISDTKHYVVAGVVPPMGLSTWDQTSWIIFGVLLILFLALLVPQGVPALLSGVKRQKAATAQAIEQKPIAAAAGATIPPPAGNSPGVMQKSGQQGIPLPTGKPVAIETTLSLGDSFSSNCVFIADRESENIEINNDKTTVKISSTKNRGEWGQRHLNDLIAPPGSEIVVEGGFNVLRQDTRAEGLSVSYTGSPDKEITPTGKMALRDGSYLKIKDLARFILSTSPRALKANYKLVDKMRLCLMGSRNPYRLPGGKGIPPEGTYLSWEQGYLVIVNKGPDYVFVKYGGEGTAERKLTVQSALKAGSQFRIGSTIYNVI